MVSSLGDAGVEPQLALDDSEVGGLWSLWFSCPTGVADVWIHVDEALRSPNRLPGKGGESCRLEPPANVTNQIYAVYKDLSACNRGFRLADVDGLCRHTVG
jgi:hypothetical protein